MLFLLMAIICSASIGVVFKLFQKYEIDTLQAIVFNYYVCGGIGFYLFSSEIGRIDELMSKPWIGYSAFLGIIFIVAFFVAANSIRYFGVSLTAIMQKISLVVTVLFAILVLGEPASLFKWIGLGLSFLAIVLINYRPKRNRQLEKISPFLLLLPFITFTFSGIIDVTIFYVKFAQLNDRAEGGFTTMIFCFAGIIGSILLLLLLITRKANFSARNIVGGIALGIPNFFSIYGLIKSLNLGIDGSIIFPVYNSGMILLATLFGVVFFKEYLKWFNLIGVIAAIVAIVFFTGGSTLMPY